ncbi:NAD(P)H-dependent oxidoreductase [Aliiroseovarius crassostreae]|uniref:NAD(P)H-dependent oxidoreductase n=1 Tax=Aliiroseovarius crassostreae TaxID=154981 RepID=UPI003C7CA1D8
MMKTLVLVAHPTMEISRVNAAWAAAFAACPDVTVHDLAATYPEMDIDVIAEQKLLLDHDRIIFQFPLYWYSSPAILKQWQDLVLAPGFAYAGAHRLEGKEFMVATSIGATEEDYRAGGHNHFSVDELLRPFQQTVNYLRGRYLTPFLFYRSIAAENDELAQSARDLLAHALNMDIDPERDHEIFTQDSLQKMFARLSAAAE